MAITGYDDVVKVTAMLRNSDDEFTVQEIVAKAKDVLKSFSSSHVNQMLSSLIN